MKTARRRGKGPALFVPVLSDAGIPAEEISQLVCHRGTTVTELVYRHQLRPVIQTAATVMDRLFDRGLVGCVIVTQLVTQVGSEPGSQAWHCR